MPPEKKSVFKVFIFISSSQSTNLAWMILALFYDIQGNEIRAEHSYSEASKPSNIGQPSIGKSSDLQHVAPKQNSIKSKLDTWLFIPHIMLKFHCFKPLVFFVALPLLISVFSPFTLRSTPCHLVILHFLA